MADYFGLAVSVFTINIIPIFMPPTWFVLAFARFNDPSYDPVMLAVVGAVSSTLGRAVLAGYSSFFRRFFSGDLERRADEIRAFFSKKGRELFLGTLAYALTPFPSNIVFIADGLTKVDPRPLFSGFFLGRLVSYFVMVSLAGNIEVAVADHIHSPATMRLIFDLVGIAGAFSVVLIDWRKVTGAAKKGEGA